MLRSPARLLHSMCIIMKHMWHNSTLDRFFGDPRPVTNIAAIRKTCDTISRVRSVNRLGGDWAWNVVPGPVLGRAAQFSLLCGLEQVAQTCGHRLLVFPGENPMIVTSVYRNLL